MVSTYCTSPSSATDGALHQQWAWTKTSLEAQLQRAIDTQEGDMTEALASVQALRSIWRRATGSRAHPRVPTGDWQHDTLEKSLTLYVTELGKAITRKSDNAKRSSLMRLLRRPIEATKRSPEEWQQCALSMLNLLHDRMRYRPPAASGSQPTTQQNPGDAVSLSHYVSRPTQSGIGPRGHGDQFGGAGASTSPAGSGVHPAVDTQGTSSASLLAHRPHARHRHRGFFDIGLAGAAGAPSLGGGADGGGFGGGGGGFGGGGGC